jgi:hypothetical protein
MHGTRIALASVVALATSCSLVTSLDGLSGGPLPIDATAEGGVESGGAVDAPVTDGPPSTTDAPSTKPRAWRQMNVAGPPGLHSARMVFDEARARSVLFGGSTSSGGSSDTWVWDGTAWSRPAITAKPTARQSPGLAYDSARHLVRLFGGSDGTPAPWEWDGGTMWKSSSTAATSPDIRYSAAMTYDRVRDVLVVFGGLTTTMPSGDNPETWEWSASSGFVKRSPALSPPPRHANVLVYDESRARVVMFAGSDGMVLNDLWEWDGTGWAQLTPPVSPPGRRAPCAAYDSVRKVMVVFGGRPDGQKDGLADTWEWDGKAWTAGASGPPGRASCAMTFDRTRNQIVMFGGSSHHLVMTKPELVADTWVYE